MVGRLTLLASVRPTTATPVGAHAGPIVTPSIHVTTDRTPGRIHTEPQMLVDPQNPEILAIAEVEFQTSTCQL